MSDQTTRKMIRAYDQVAPVTGFLTGQFQSPAENFYNTEEVEFDIIREDEDIAIVVTDPSTGTRVNADDLYTNKSFKPPIYDETVALNSFDLLKRAPGDNPFANRTFRSKAIARMYRKVAKVNRMIARSVELNAGQVLTTGTLTLIDKSGNSLYVVSFSPKTAHFPTVTTDWDQAGADPIADLISLNAPIRVNGQSNPDMLIFGSGAFNNFINNATVQSLFDNRQIDQGTISPVQLRGSGEYRGQVQVGSYKQDVWTYDGRYKHPQTGTSTPYIPTDKVVSRISSGRLDATFGAVPNLAKEFGMRADMFPEIPGRITIEGKAIDLNLVTYIAQDGRQMFTSVATRPLLIPTGIDTFGCLDTIQ